MDIEYAGILTGENCRQFRSFIGQFVYQVGVEGMG